APARSTVARQLIFHQPPQCELSLVRPYLRSCGLVKPDEASRKKAHAFARVFLPDAQYGPQINGKPPHALQQHSTQESRLEGKRTHKRVETVEGVVAAIVILFQPA